MGQSELCGNSSRLDVIATVLIELIAGSTRSPPQTGWRLDAREIVSDDPERARTNAQNNEFINSVVRRGGRRRQDRHGPSIHPVHGRLARTAALVGPWRFSLILLL
jgi:hypothetical protein